MVIFMRGLPVGRVSAIIATAALILATLLCARGAEAKSESKEATGIPYGWASKRMDAEIWGMAHSDVDGDGHKEVILLERERLLVGRFEGIKFKGNFRCEWEGVAKGARIDMYDLDGDGRDEALITAVEEGEPASLALKFEGNGCKQIVSKFPMSLRVMEIPVEGSGWTQGIVAQGWSSQKYFTGPVYRMKFEKGKLAIAGKLKLPWLTQLYRFAFLPQEDDETAVVLYKSAAPLEIRTNVKGKKWKKVWRSPERYGSSGNTIRAVQRPALDQVQSAYASFELPPLVIRDPASANIMMVKYDMPLHNVVGRTPYIKGSRIYEYRPDPAFIYTEDLRTQHMPGDVVSYYVDDDGTGRTLTVLMQDNRGFFENPTQSMVLKFKLPGKKDEEDQSDQSQKSDDR